MSEETTAPEAPKMTTAFAVFVDAKGDVLVERDPSIFAIEVERPSTLLEVRRYASEIVMDLQAQAAAEYVMMANKSQAEAK